jgi:hypothetical protein
MNICGEIRSRLYRLLTPIRSIRVDDGAKPPVKANVTYYGDNGVRPHARKRSAGERDR